MTDEYIENHFGDIQKHACGTEKRLCDSISISGLKAENRIYTDGFEKSNEKTVLINQDYEQTVAGLLG